MRIFEVRYLDMIGKCRKANAPFGVVSLRQGSEVQRPGVTEEFCDVGTLAMITDFSQVQPGLVSIRCEGLQRFRVTASQRMKHGLWIADVERIADDAPAPVPADLQGAAGALGRLLDAIRERGTPEEAAALPQIRHLEDCGWVANRWCEILPLPLPIKQQLMALDNPVVRLELVGDFLARSRIPH